MIDAEQTYLQASIGQLVLALQYKYNKSIPWVYNTYQCYRKVMVFIKSYYYWEEFQETQLFRLPFNYSLLAQKSFSLAPENHISHSTSISNLSRLSQTFS